MIGIIGAMEEEVNALKALMNVDEVKDIQGYSYNVGRIEGKDVVLVQGGVGKVNATISATLMMVNYPIDYVINIGTAGGLSSDENIGDVVVSEKVVHYDVDLIGFDEYEIGELPQLPRFFKADEEMLDKVKTILSKKSITCHVGLIASGDQFVYREDQVNNIKKNFPEALCSEMEAASIAQVCYVFNKKFIITRSLSDIYDKGDSSMQFDEFVNKASQASATMCVELIKEL